LTEKEVAAGSEIRVLSVLVADLRGFTRATEGKSPAQAAQLVQKCLEALSAGVSLYGGTIEKFTGDGLMAIWGAPHADPEHARHALQAALHMQGEVRALAGWLKENGFNPMRVSIGINTGEMAVGIFGKTHRAWTAHGDAVNLATRIEQLTRELGVDLLVGEETARHLRFVDMENMGAHLVKGRQEKVTVYGLKMQNLT